MGNKDTAIEELKKQIQLGRERLGPEGVKQLEQMAKGLIPVSEVPAADQNLDTVPYDKETALKALEIYLQNHGDPEELERRILAMVDKQH